MDKISRYYREIINDTTLLEIELTLHYKDDLDELIHKTHTTEKDDNSITINTVRSIFKNGEVMLLAYSDNNYIKYDEENDLYHHYINGELVESFEFNDDTYMIFTEYYNWWLKLKEFYKDF